MSNFLSRDSQILAKDIVVIDGFSSTGKSLIGPIFGYLERSEQWQIDDFYEYIAILNYLGEVSSKSLSAIIKVKADKLLYNLYIGRGVNFRATDLSSPYYDNLQDLYLQRLKKEEGDSASEEILKCNPILPLNIHCMFGYSRALFDGFDDRLKLYILMLRDPFFLIDAWHKGGWVNRVCLANREFNLCIKFHNNSIPWYALEYADKYLVCTDFEKAMLTVYNLYIRIFKMYESLNHQEKDKIIIVFFDEYKSNPEGYIDRICHILNTKKSDKFQYIMEKLSLPRKDKDKDVTTLKNFSNAYKEEISEEFYNLMKNLESEYLNFYSKNIFIDE